MVPTATTSLPLIVGPGELSSSFKFPLASPLSTLARQTPRTHRRAHDQLKGPSPAPFDGPSTSLTPQYQSVPFINQEEPTSPLLHSRFRVSTLTEVSKDDSSYFDASTIADGYRYRDRDSVYSNVTAMPPSPLSQPAHLWPPAPPDPVPLSDPDVIHDDDEAYADDAFIPSPTVIVVSPPDPDPCFGSSAERRSPIIAPMSSNFSRPVRRPPENTEMQKRLVLQRNAGRSSPLLSETSASNTANRAGSRSPDPSPLRSPTPTAYTHPTPSSSSLNAPQPMATQASRALNNFLPPPQIIVSVAPDVNPESSEPTQNSIAEPSHPPRMTAQDYLLLGIEHHENNRLKESAMCFERSAKEQGGCGVGMIMWGLTLRHGWGCGKNEKQGFKWLQKAAEGAVDDLEKAQGGIDSRAVQNELILAIYEVGQCFFHGWGVRKDRVMAVKYYMVAARLGDADAQQDLAFCLANGKGCKKDKKAAAMWHRAAVAQGSSDIGLAWIYKEKYQ